MAKQKDEKLAHLQQLCLDLDQHVRLLRDFATSPGGVWMARDELSKASTIFSELERLLDDIKSETDQPRPVDNL